MGGPKGSNELNSLLEDQATSPSSHRHRRRQLFAVVAVSLVALTFIICALVVATIVHYYPNGQSPSGLSLTYTQSLSLSPSFPESPSPSPNYPESDCIKAACNVTQFPVSCFSTLSSTLNDSQKSDPELIYRASLNITLARLSNLSSFTETLRGEDPPSEAAMQDCRELVELASHHVNDTISLMEVAPGEEIWTEFKIKHMQSLLSGAITCQWTCLDGLEMMNSSLVDEVTFAMQPSRQITSISLAILNNILVLLQICSVW